MFYTVKGAITRNAINLRFMKGTTNSLDRVRVRGNITYGRSVYEWEVRYHMEGVCTSVHEWEECLRVGRKIPYERSVRMGGVCTGGK